MLDESDPIHWQDEDVTERLVKHLLDKSEPWRAACGAGVVDNLERASIAMQDALAFAGERADAYQIARRLEERWFWPVDEKLVRCLSDLQGRRDAIIQELEKERNHKKFEFEPGFRFQNPHYYFTITEVSLLGYYKAMGFANSTLAKDSTFIFTEEEIQYYVEKYGLPSKEEFNV